MPSFRYTAINPAGKLTQGVMEAASEDAVVSQLQRQGHIPMRAQAAGGGRLVDLLTRDIGGGGLTRQEVANVTRELSIMLSAGQDLDRSLRFLIETSAKTRVRSVLDAIRQSVRDGATLATALGRHPSSFSRLYVGLVRAGEAGGNLAPTLERLALLLERQRALSATITSALIYPTMLLVAAIGSVTLLLTQVLPQFVPLFEQNGARLPESTQVLIEAGDFVSSYGLWLLGLMALAVVAARLVLRRPAPRLATDRAMLRLPVIGTLLREIIAARFTRTLGTLLVNGVPLIAALEIVRHAVGNTAGVAAIEIAAIQAKGGGGLSRPLDDSGVFPRRTIHLLRLGEETAQLGGMALRAAEIHEEQTRISAQRLVSLLVPVITIVMGAVIAVIVASLLLAMLGLNDLAS